MRQLRQRYEVTDEVMSFVDQALALTSFQTQWQPDLHGSNKECNYNEGIAQHMSNRARFPPPGSRTKSWSEVLVRNPRLYLRLSFALDYALARGQFPRDSDLDTLLSPVEIGEANLDIPALVLSDHAVAETVVSEYLCTGEAAPATCQLEQFGQVNTQELIEPPAGPPDITGLIDTTDMSAIRLYDQSSSEAPNLDYFDLESNATSRFG